MMILSSVGLRHPEPAQFPMWLVSTGERERERTPLCRAARCSGVWRCSSLREEEARACAHKLSFSLVVSRDVLVLFSSRPGACRARARILCAKRTHGDPHLRERVGAGVEERSHAARARRDVQPAPNETVSMFACVVFDNLYLGRFQSDWDDL